MAKLASAVMTPVSVLRGAGGMGTSIRPAFAAACMLASSPPAKCGVFVAGEPRPTIERLELDRSASLPLAAASRRERPRDPSATLCDLFDSATAGDTCGAAIADSDDCCASA